MPFSSAWHQGPARDRRDGPLPCLGDELLGRGWRIFSDARRDIADHREDEQMAFPFFSLNSPGNKTIFVSARPAVRGCLKEGRGCDPAAQDRAVALSRSSLARLLFSGGIYLDSSSHPMG